MTKQTNIELLNKLASDKSLHELTNTLNEFNIFKVLGIVDREIKHSNFLAWLFDPKENHGLGSRFLKKFLLKYAYLNNNQVLSDDINSFIFNRVIVKREWKDIDILIIIEENNKKFIFIIENKIWARESEDQLKKYQKTISEEFKNKYSEHFIFLAPDEHEKPSDKKWVNYGYSFVENILTDLKTEINNSDVFKIITDYITILKRDILKKDDNVDGLTRKIWKEHRKVLLTIFRKDNDISNALSEEYGEALDVLKRTPTLLHGFEMKFWSELHNKGLTDNEVTFTTEVMKAGELFNYRLAKDTTGLFVQLVPDKKEDRERTKKIYEDLKSTLWRKVKNFRKKDPDFRKKEPYLYEIPLIKIKPNQIFEDIETYDKKKIEDFENKCKEFFKDMEKIENTLAQIAI